MTHYQKLATMIFRIIGILFSFVGLSISIIAFVSMLIVFNFAAVLIIAIYSIPLIVIGGLLFSFSKKLGKWICFDFEKFNEQ